VIPLPGDSVSGTQQLRKVFTMSEIGPSGTMTVGLVSLWPVWLMGDEVWTKLERRWPDIMMSDPSNTEPACGMSVDNIADLARHRRGIAPLRIVILEQAAASHDGMEEPIPAGSRI
jgi:hypothetical protein